ncbi:hypothetical protein, partial [Klebsiella pneumoniae]
VALGLALLSRGDIIQAEICGEEAFHRFRALCQFSNKYNSRAGSDELLFLASAFTQLGVIADTSENLAWLVDKNSPDIW